MVQKLVYVVVYQYPKVYD
uniref:Uncharacterized protein n=1 Tax=Arundo donax TaxID=35708 RepID=A0A0A9GPG3_ARUDO